MEVKNRALLFVSVGVLFVSIVLFFSFSFTRPIEEAIFDIEFSIGDEIGVISDRFNLNYGTLLPGMASVKELNFENSHDFDVVVYVSVEKDLVEYFFGDKKFFLLANQKVQYPLKLSVPLDVEYGNYSGKVMFRIFKRARFL